MIITIITASILVVSILGWIFIDGWKHENLQIAAICSTIGSGLILLIMLICIVCGNTMRSQKVNALQAKREALVYQMDHELYLGDSLGKFNEEIISGRYYHDNPWTSWFVGGHYYEVDPIDLKSN